MNPALRDVQKIPCQCFSFHPGGDSPVRMEQSVNPHNVNCLLPDKPANAPHSASKSPYEFQMLSGVERGAQPVNSSLRECDPRQAESAFGITRLIRQHNNNMCITLLEP